MWAVVPFVFCIGVWTNVLTHAPPHFHKWIGVFSKVIVFQRGFVKQQKQIPVTVIVIISTSTGTIKIERTAFGQYFSRH